MELFSLGIGNYTEVDVKEAARALTGWTVVDGVFREASRRARRRREDHLRPEGRAGRVRSDQGAWSKCRRPRCGWRGGSAGFFSASRGRRSRRAIAGRRHARAPARRRLGRRDDLAVECVLCGCEHRHACAQPGGIYRRRHNRPGTPGRAAARHWCWPTGWPGWGRTSFIRPTWAAGPEAGRGSRRVR